MRALLRSGRVPSEFTNMGIEICLGDLTDAASLRGIVEGVDAVCHLAGVLGQTGFDDDHYYRINVNGTANLIAECINHPIKRFVHCSTAGVLGPTNEDVADESHPFNPSNVYETTKAEAERLVLENFRENRLPAIVLRPGMVLAVLSVTFGV